MKRVLLFLLLTFTVTTFSQTDSIKVVNLTKEVKEHQKNGWMRLGVGTFAHIISTLNLVGGPLSDPDVYNPFIVYNGLGLGMDIMALIEFNRARKKKKEIEKVLNK
jgi:hypothetical protein